MEITTFWCEYDIGINERVFKDEDVARSHVSQALRDCDLEESLEELEEDGLVGFETQVVIEAPYGSQYYRVAWDSDVCAEG